MDVNILDKDLNLVKVLDNFDNLLWNTQYNSVGEFQLICDKQYFSILQEGNKIQNTEDDEFIGVIEKVRVESNEQTKKNTMTVSGRMIESMLDQRAIMEGAYRKDIEPAEFISVVVDKNAINPVDPGRTIPGLQMGELGISDLGTIDYENAYSNLLDVTERVCQRAELGFKITTDIKNKTYTLNIYKGKDLTQGTVDNPVILSKDFDNVNTSEYEKSNRNYKNVVYIKGEEEFKTSISTGDYTGLERREMFVDQTSISRTLEDGTILADEEYAKLLQDSTMDQLIKAIKEEFLYNSLDPNSNYKYKKDFDLGDLVTCTDSELGISIDVRIKGIEQSWDRLNGYSIFLNLGETKITVKDAIAKHLASTINVR